MVSVTTYITHLDSTEPRDLDVDVAEPARSEKTHLSRVCPVLETVSPHIIGASRRQKDARECRFRSMMISKLVMRSQ